MTRQYATSSGSARVPRRSGSDANRLHAVLPPVMLLAAIGLATLAHPVAPGLGVHSAEDGVAILPLPWWDSTPTRSLREDLILLACQGLRASGKTPIHQGEAGYSLFLDSDRDGLACE